MSETIETKNADGNPRPRTGKKSKKARAAGRMERRFVAHSANSPWLVRVLGMVGATTLGAGAYAYFYGESFKKAAEAARAAAGTAHDAVPAEAALPLYMIAFAAVVLGVTIWLGTSSEVPLRVGAPGISMERGEVRRMPWWAVSSIAWEAGTLALVISGKDESGAEWTFKVHLKAHGEALGWILKEALDRVPKIVDIKDSVLDELPGANPHAGMKVELEPLQVVGKKDAISGKLVSYEPDARVCTRCERVYFKRSVPKKCKCGASLLELRTAVGQEPGEDEEEEGEEEEDDARESDAKAKAAEESA